MNLEKPDPAKQIAKRMKIWVGLIAAGAFAYGLGLSQGSAFRMKRSMASLQAPVKAGLSPVAFETLGKPKNTEHPKSN